MRRGIARGIALALAGVSILMLSPVKPVKAEGLKEVLERNYRSIDWSLGMGIQHIHAKLDATEVKGHVWGPSLSFHKAFPPKTHLDANIALYSGTTELQRKFQYDEPSTKLLEAKISGQHYIYRNLGIHLGATYSHWKLQSYSPISLTKKDIALGIVWGDFLPSARISVMPYVKRASLQSRELDSKRNVFGWGIQVSTSFPLKGTAGNLVCFVEKLKDQVTTKGLKFSVMF